jgi:hypothetical protein
MPSAIHHRQKHAEFNFNHNFYSSYARLHGNFWRSTYQVITYLVEALCYKPEGRGFDSRWGHWIFFNLPNPSSRIMGLGSTQPLTEMRTSNLPGVNGGRRVRLTSPPSASRLCRKIWQPRRLTTLLASTAYYRHSFTLLSFKGAHIIRRKAEGRNNIPPALLLDTLSELNWLYSVRYIYGVHVNTASATQLTVRDVWMS